MKFSAEKDATLSYIKTENVCPKKFENGNFRLNLKVLVFVILQKNMPDNK